MIQIHAESSPDSELNRQPGWTEELLELIHDPEFKDWFGDWENQNENASKVVDKNGRPRLVYFGNVSGIQQLHGNARRRTRNDEIGFFTTAIYTNAQFYASTMQDPVTDKLLPSSVYCAFVNIRNPRIKKPHDGLSQERVTEVPEDFDGYFNPTAQEYQVFSPDQIRIVGEIPVNKPPIKAPLSNVFSL